MISLRCLGFLASLAAMAGQCAAQCSLDSPAQCNIGQAKLEVNLAGLPLSIMQNGVRVNAYTGPASAYYPNCPTTIPDCSTLTVQQYTQALLANYAAQGVTGVRFQIGLGDGDSRAFNSDGTVNSDWLSVLGTFFNDLKSNGITSVTLTPSTGWFNVDTDFYTDHTFPLHDHLRPCGAQGVTVRYIKWLPYGLEPANAYAPECASINLAYNNARAPNEVSPTFFWGWRPFFTLINQMLQTASQKGLTVEELDIENEVDLEYTTVQARLIYDNKQDLNGTVGGTTDVLTTLRKIMSKWGYDPGHVTYSVVTETPTVSSPTDDCTSLYGSPSLLFSQSQLEWATKYGPTVAATFGLPGDLNYFDPEHPYLPCGGTTTGLTNLPVSYRYTDFSGVPTGISQNGIPAPPQQNVASMVDTHTYICQRDPNDGTCVDSRSYPVSGIENVFHNDANAYLAAVASDPLLQVQQTLMLGETNFSQPDNQPIDRSGNQAPYLNYCQMPQRTAYDHTAGFLLSTLFANPVGVFPNSSNVIFRPFENPAVPTNSGTGCTGGTVNPALIGSGTPNGPYKKGN